MKRLIFASLIILAGVSASQAVTVSSTTRSLNGTPPLRVEPNESFIYSIGSSTFTGKINLQRSRNLQNWEPVGISTTNHVSGAFTDTFYNDERVSYYRWQASTITAGQFDTTLTDSQDLVAETKNHKKVPILQVFDDELKVLGALTVTGAGTFGSGSFTTIDASTSTSAPTQSTAPRSATVGVTPTHQWQFIINTTDSEVCLATGTTNTTWVKVSTPSQACAH